MNLKLLCIVFTSLVAVNALKLNGRIIDGFEADDIHSFAVRVISIINDNTPQGYLSSGVAVTAQHVVTVGQAISGFSVWNIGYGSIQVENQQYIISRSAVIHPQFNANPLNSNIGVIRVPYVLPNWNYKPINFESSFQVAMVAFGYGFTNNQPLLAKTLKRAYLFTQPVATCSGYFNDMIVQVSENFCTTSASQIGNGDQGGPVIDMYFGGVFGLLSFWGQTEGSPIVIVEFSEYQEFLETNLAI